MPQIWGMRIGFSAQYAPARAKGRGVLKTEDTLLWRARLGQGSARRARRSAGRRGAEAGQC